MDPETEVANLRKLLTDRLHRAGVPPHEVSAELGFHASYLHRALRGDVPLKVKTVMGVLFDLNIDPEEFFQHHYPLGGEATKVLRDNPPPGVQRDDWARQMLRRLREREGVVWNTETLTKFLQVAVRHLLRRAKIRQETASLALGRGPQALCQALHGRTDLTFEHVFGVLALCRVSPARFFFNAFLREHGKGRHGIDVDEIIDALEPLFEQTSIGFATRRGLWPNKPS